MMETEQGLRRNLFSTFSQGPIQTGSESGAILMNIKIYMNNKKEHKQCLLPSHRPVKRLEGKLNYFFVEMTEFHIGVSDQHWSGFLKLVTKGSLGDLDSDQLIVLGLRTLASVLHLEAELGFELEMKIAYSLCVVQILKRVCDKTDLKVYDVDQLDTSKKIRNRLHQISDVLK